MAEREIVMYVGLRAYLNMRALNLFYCFQISSRELERIEEMTASEDFENLQVAESLLDNLSNREVDKND